MTVVSSKIRLNLIKQDIVRWKRQFNFALGNVTSENPDDEKGKRNENKTSKA